MFTKPSKSHSSKYFTYCFQIVSLFFAISLCSIFNSSGTTGPMWIDELVITSDINIQGDPVDRVEIFKSGISRVYCFSKITRPDQIKLGVRWYHEDKLIWTDVMNFGTERKTAVFLAREGDGPFPPGNYRCEVYAVEKPLETVNFRVEQPEDTEE